MDTQEPGPARRARRTERAASLVEYALLLALIAVVLVSAVTMLGESGQGSLEDSVQQISDARP